MSRRRPMSVGAAGQSLWTIPPAAGAVGMRRASLATGWFGSMGTTSDTLVTALSITGRAGCLVGLNLQAPSSGARVEITLDGHLIHHGGTNGIALSVPNGFCMVSSTGFLQLRAGTAAGWESNNSNQLLRLNFAASLLLRLRTASAGTTVTLSWQIEGEPA